mgnify:CR=1 FL=1
MQPSHSAWRPHSGEAERSLAGPHNVAHSHKPAGATSHDAQGGRDALVVRHEQGRDREHQDVAPHQHLAVDIHCRVDDDGAMCLRSGEQRFYEGPLRFRFPLLLSGVANVREWWDEQAQRFPVLRPRLERTLQLVVRGSTVAAMSRIRPRLSSTFPQPTDQSGRY